MQSKQTLILLDGNALLHRAWHAVPLLTTEDGRVVNAAYGFANVLDKMLREYKPDFMVVAWDLPGKTIRHEKFDTYKAQRKEKEPELYAQIPIIQDILACYGIPSVSMEGYEADDVIGTLSKRGESEGMRVLIVTGDQDQLQLVTENVHVIYFVKGLSETIEFDITRVKEKFGFEPIQLIDYKALRGDPSDNIAGVAGIGEKAAKELIAEYGSVEAILKAVNDGTILPKYAKKLHGQEQVAMDSKWLVTIIIDLFLDFSFSSAKMGNTDSDRLIAMYKDLEFKNLLKRTTESVPKAVVEKISDLSEIQIIRAESGVANALRQLEGSDRGLLVASQAPDLFGSKLAAIAVSDGLRTIVIPNPNTAMIQLVSEVLQGNKNIASHDYKRAMHEAGLPWIQNMTDVMITSYLRSSGTRDYDLPSLFSTVSVPEQYTSEKDLCALGILTKEVIKKSKEDLIQIRERGMDSVWSDIEKPLIPLLFEMEQTGICVDTSTLSKLSVKLESSITEVTKEIIRIAGREFNVSSPMQLSEILFTDLALPTKGIKKTQQGFSTAASELDKLEDLHEIIPLIRTYREHTKLKSTYVETLPNLVREDGRIHTTYNQTIAATGRLSSTDPNLQNIPIKTELGNEIRKAFVAERGKKLISIDYSQIELRLMAVYAKDEPFIRAFQDGADIHTRTASEVFEISESEVTSDHRRKAKAINFGILYGMGARSLARSTNMSTKEAEEFIERYFTIHHAIKTYLDETKTFAHVNGYVETYFKRRRLLPDIHSGIQMLTANAERMAINMPIQGTAADLMKLAMLSVDGWLKTSGWPAKILLQVHDELVIECDQMAVDVVIRGVKEMMEGVVKFPVPLTTNVEVGDNWGEMMEIE